MLQSSELLPTKMSPSPKNHVHLVRFDGGRVRGAGVVDDKTQLPRCLFSLVTSRDADIHILGFGNHIPGCGYSPCRIDRYCTVSH